MSKPALAPQLASGLNLILAPLDPPVPSSLEYVPVHGREPFGSDQMKFRDIDLSQGKGDNKKLYLRNAMPTANGVGGGGYTPLITALGAIHK